MDDTASLFFPVFQIPQNGYHLYNLPLQILPTLDHDNGCVMKRYIFAHDEIVRYSFKLTGFAISLVRVDEVVKVPCQAH